MNKFIVYILVFFLNILFTNAQETEIILKTATGNLEGSMLVPDKKEKMPLVLIIAGSGPTDRNGNQGDMENNSLKMLANELFQQGIASVRYDKRGVGQSSDAGKDEIDLKFDDYVNDVKAWVEFLDHDERFSKIIVAGHSEGSLLGMIACSKTEKAGAFISIAGAGRPADVILKEQLQIMPDNIKQIVFPMLDQVKKGDTISNVPPIFYALLRPSVQPYMTSWFKYDPQEQIKKLKIPILIIQGNTDIQVSEQDAELLQKAKKGALLKIIQNMNHVLKDCKNRDKEAQKSIYSDPVLPLNKEFVQAVNNFILTLPAAKN